MNNPTSRKNLFRMVLGIILGAGLAACAKTDKQSAAGGGSSTQSVMSIKGAAR